MKTKSIALLIAVLASISVHGQDSKSWHFGLGASPEYCYRIISSHDTGFASESYFKFRKENEKAQPGFSAGFWVKYAHSPALEFESGIQYVNIGYQLHLKNIRVTTDVDPDGVGFANGDYINSHRFRYINVPFKFNLVLADLGNVKFHTTAGVSLNVLIEQRNTTTWPGEPVHHSFGDPTYSNRAINCSPLAGVGLDFRMSGRMRMSVEPVFRYGLIPVYKGDPIRTRLWSGGINAVLYIQM